MQDALLEEAPVGLGALDADLRWVRVNPALAALHRLDVDAMVGRRPSELVGALGERGEVVARRVLETGGREQETVEGELVSEPGVHRAWEVAWFRVPDGVGVAAVDVTERRRAEAALAEAHRRDAILARAGLLLSTALSVQETADLVADLVVPELADWCFVELVRDHGQIDRVAFSHRDPSKLPWIAEVDRLYPLDPSSPVGSPKVVRTGEPELIEDLPDEFLVQAALDEKHLELLRGIGFSSALIVPLVARGRVLGDIALATDSHSGRRLTRDLLPVAQTLADRCALALDNAMVYAQRDLVALSLQEELLPRRLPSIPGLDVAARYLAAGEGNEVGGDFYDVFASGAGWQVVIGDVVGKGPAAAAVTGLARHTLRVAGAYEYRPSRVLDVLNRALLRDDDGGARRRLASVVAVRMEPADGGLALTVSAAGHPLPLLVKTDGTVREVGAFGQLLGVDESLDVSDAEVTIGSGDLLVLYTDGVIDARGPAGLFGEERLRALLAQTVHDAPTRVLQRVEAAVLALSGGRPRDDMAMVALRLRPR